MTEFDDMEIRDLPGLFRSPDWVYSTSPFSVMIGTEESGKPVMLDITQTPHLLISGATGTGKSTLIRDILLSLWQKADPSQLRILLIDFKKIELTLYKDIPGLLIPVITEEKIAEASLSWLESECMERMKKLDKDSVRSIDAYNHLHPEKQMPRLLLIADDFSMIQENDAAFQSIYDNILEITRNGRAVGVHIILGMQRPSSPFMQTIAKAGFPSRISFRTTSQIDSRLILDQNGAEKLPCPGGMLVKLNGSGKVLPVMCADLPEDYERGLISGLKQNSSPNKYEEEIINRIYGIESPAHGRIRNERPTEEMYFPAEDEFLEKAIELVNNAGFGSIPLFQKRLRVGYARAGRILDELTEMGILEEGEGPTKPSSLCKSSISTIDQVVIKPFWDNEASKKETKVETEKKSEIRPQPFEAVKPDPVRMPEERPAPPKIQSQIKENEEKAGLQSYVPLDHGTVKSAGEELTETGALEEQASPTVKRRLRRTCALAGNPKETEFLLNTETEKNKIKTETAEHDPVRMPEEQPVPPNENTPESVPAFVKVIRLLTSMALSAFISAVAVVSIYALLRDRHFEKAEWALILMIPLFVILFFRTKNRKFWKQILLAAAGFLVFVLLFVILSSLKAGDTNLCGALSMLISYVAVFVLHGFNKEK